MRLQRTTDEHRQLREVAREYQQHGYDVVIEPSPDQLPTFLSHFQIAILARKDGENVVVEVRSQPSLTSKPELDAIARAIQGQPSWRFDLVVRNPRDRSSVPFKDATSLAPTDITSRLLEAQELSDEEHGEAALLLAWSAAEALLRYISEAEAIPVTAHDPSQVMKSLVTYGVLDKEQYQVLQECFATRNMVVHGYKEQRSLPDAVKQILVVADQLQRQYQSS